MFKFIHAADIHLDSPLRGLSRYETAPVESIRNACRKAFENLVDLAIDEKVSFILLAGDLYDGDWKDFNIGIFLSREMGKLAKHNIPVFAVAGNHDAQNKMTKALDTPGNLRIFSAENPESIVLKDLNTIIHGRSFSWHNEKDNLAGEFPIAEKGRFNIGLLHTSLDGRPGHDNYAPCSVSDLQSKNYQYWALGHIHKMEYVRKDPWIVFPGCIQGRNIRETGQKGCILAVVEDNKIKKISDYSLDVFRWAVSEIDISDLYEMNDLYDKTRKNIISRIKEADGRRLGIRIKFTGNSPLAEEILAYPERFQYNIRALIAETAVDKVWLEKIDNEIKGRHDLSSVISNDTAFASMMRNILNIKNDPCEIEGLNGVFDELKRNIPYEAFGGETGINIDEDSVKGNLIEEGSKMLIARLLESGDDQ